MPRRKPVAGDADKDAKVVIYCRIDPATVRGLDAICKTMRPEPTRAQLIDLACSEYVSRHGANSKAAKAGAQ